MEQYPLHSRFTHQDYMIVVHRPANYVPSKAYTLLYIADGSQGIGQVLLDSTNSISLPNDSIVIAINHTSNREANRDRDFIPSDISKNAKENFGQAHLFYQFIKEELIPFVHNEFPHRTAEAFIGHSLSGLFCLYLALHDKQLFHHYFSISPSVWANSFELLKIEQAYSKKHKDLPANIFVYAGSLEIFNLIRIPTWLFIKAISKRKYPNLHLTYTVIPGKQHFTIRKPALEQIMNTLKQLL
jgi:predicted alpha/beta superfamily hydrolase